MASVILSWVRNGRRDCPDWEADGTITCGARFIEAGAIASICDPAWYECTRTKEHAPPHVAHVGVFDGNELVSVRVGAVGSTMRPTLVDAIVSAAVAMIDPVSNG